MPPISEPPIPIAVVIQIGIGSWPGDGEAGEPADDEAPRIRIEMMKRERHLP